LTEHTFLEMVWSRVFGILAGYEDQNGVTARRRPRWGPTTIWNTW
jgi:hypothetical protein